MELDLLHRVWWPYLHRAKKIRFSDDVWEFFVSGTKRTAERNVGGPGILLSFPQKEGAKSPSSVR